MGASFKETVPDVGSEVVPGLGDLYEKGWRPLRTILIASWDSEEVRLLYFPPSADLY